MNLCSRVPWQSSSCSRTLSRTYSGIAESVSENGLQYGKKTNTRILNRRHILLKNIPTTATVSDLKRFVKCFGLNDVVNTHILYKNFKPLGRALLTLGNSSCLVSNLRRLTQPTLAGFPITAISADPPPLESFTAKTRNLPVKLAQSLQNVGQSHTLGDPINGPARALSSTVTVSGLPGKLEMSAVKHYFRAYHILGQETGKHLITKIPMPNREFSLYSTYVMHLASPSEAHRLVRNVHQTYFLVTQNGKRFKLHARILH